MCGVARTLRNCAFLELAGRGSIVLRLRLSYRGACLEYLFSEQLGFRDNALFLSL